MPPVSRDYRITDVKLAREIWLGQRAASLLGSIDRLYTCVRQGVCILCALKP